jgi:hypothetical protein
MGEKWREIPGIESMFGAKYEVSSFGRFRSMPRKSKISDRIIPGRNIRTHVDDRGYVSVHLKDRTYRAHRVVASVFLPNPENKPEVNHIDGNKANNRISNLEWATKSENFWHSVGAGLRKLAISDDDVLYIRKNFKAIGKNNLAEMYGVHPSYIYNIAVHKDKEHVKTEVFQTDSPQKCTPIIQMDNDGNVVARYESQSAAAKALGIKLSHIQRVVKGKRNHCNGMYFKPEV